MTNLNKTPEKTAAKTSCGGACDCTTCSCGCPQGGCQCQQSNCQCGCRKPKTGM